MSEFPRVTVRLVCPTCLARGRTSVLVQWFIPTVGEDAGRAPIFLDAEHSAPSWESYAVGGDTGPGTERDELLGIEWSRADTTRPGDEGHVKHEARCDSGCGYHYKRRATLVRRFLEYVRTATYAQGRTEVLTFDAGRADEVMNTL